MRSLPLLLVSVLALGGCAGNMRLLEDGKSHPGTFHAVSKTMEVSIDGVRYAGDFTQAVSVGFGQSFGTAFSGGRSAFGSAFGTSISTTGASQAVLQSSNGKVIQCGFSLSFGRGSGQCEGLDGRRFVIVLGNAPGDAAASGQIPLSMSACAGTWANGRCN